MTESNLIRIRIPDPLREHAGGADSLEVRAATVRDAVGVLGKTYPELAQRILTRGGELRPYVNLFLDGENLRELNDLDTPLRDGQILQILPSVAGG